MKSWKSYVTLAALTVLSCSLCAQAKPFKVAWLMPSTVTDYSWCQSMYSSLEQVQKELGEDQFEFAYSESMFRLSDADEAIRDYADEGYDLIICHGSQYGALLKEIAPEYEETSFCWGTGGDPMTKYGIKNVFGYNNSIDQASYILGVVAAKITKSKVVGWVGPVKAASTKKAYEGYVKGVKDTDPSVEVKESWTGSYSDLALATEAANTQVKAGADVFTGNSQIQLGTIGVCKKTGTYYLGTQDNQIPFAPDNVVMCEKNNWYGIIKEMMALIKEGTLGGRVLTATLDNGGLELCVNDALLKKTTGLDLSGQALQDAVYGAQLKAVKAGKVVTN